MKRPFVVGAGVAVMLAAAGFAVASSVDNNVRGISRVSATFTASTTSSQTHTCTTADGKTLATTTARYAGQATGAASAGDLTGPMTLSVRTIINVTDNVGYVDGSLRIAAGAGRTDAHFTAVYDNGAIAGIVEGHAATHGQLVANISAGLGPTGFTAGKLGGGTAGGSAVELAPGRCAPAKTIQQTSRAKGTVSVVSTTSITVAGLTCAVPSSMASKLIGIRSGDQVEIKCSLIGGTNTLVKIEKKH